ncbi:MAG: PfkB family carbohydrate kinase [Pelolinea sp.]|nr:PfkB family carbohydrate kinase [Pelolinea sp.]
MDCQAHNHSLEGPKVIDALGKTDIFSPNAEEARRLTGKDDLRLALAELSRVTSMVIIKDGKSGCHLQDARQTIHEPGINVDVVDTTGARR